MALALARAIVVAVPVHLHRDLHLASCGLAQAGGPSATLACAECGRARWMHNTRHDTCAKFRWMRYRQITSAEIKALRAVIGISPELDEHCAEGLNERGPRGETAEYIARCACINAINEAHTIVAGMQWSLTHYAEIAVVAKAALDTARAAHADDPHNITLAERVQHFERKLADAERDAAREREQIDRRGW